VSIPKKGEFLFHLHTVSRSAKLSNRTELSPPKMSLTACAQRINTQILYKNSIYLQILTFPTLQIITLEALIFLVVVNFSV